MDVHAVAIYLICDEVVNFFGIIDDPQSKMTSSEIMTFALFSALHFQCDYKKTRLVAHHLKFFKNILSNSRLLRRLHAIEEKVWIVIFYLIRMCLKHSTSNFYIVDSFPVGAYQNHKSFRARIFKGKPYHGYAASKKAYFFGLKVHMIIDESGLPIEFCITPGGVSDIEGLKHLPCDLPAGSILIGDRAYNSYGLEEDLKELAGISLMPKRKISSQRQHERTIEYIHSCHRNKIETVFSGIVSKMPRQIKARTEKGFYLKIIFFILGHVVGVYLAKT